MYFLIEYSSMFSRCGRIVKAFSSYLQAFNYFNFLDSNLYYKISFIEVFE